jgi:hypothetical protein
MSRIDVAAIERIVANTIVETARGDPDALASRIVAALAEAGYRIAAVNLAKDTNSSRQRDQACVLDPATSSFFTLSKRKGTPASFSKTARSTISQVGDRVERV